jgi:hypothetical protein
MCAALVIAVWRFVPPPPTPTKTAPVPVAPAPAKPPTPAPPWVSQDEIEQQRKIGRTLLIYSPQELLTMSELGQDLKVYTNKWTKIDYPITSLPVSETVEKKEFYVVRMNVQSANMYGQDQVSAYFEPKKWGDQLLNLRIRTNLRALCQFMGFEQKTINPTYKIYSNTLVGYNCELL